MKRIYAFLICVVLLSALLLPASAAESAAVIIAPEKPMAAAGEEITFTVELRNVPQCRSVGVFLLFDTDAFELVRGEMKLEGALRGDFAMDGSCVCMFEDPTAPSGIFCEFTLRVKSGAASGEYRITAEFSVEGAVSTECVSPATVTLGLRGDINGDGSVTDEDVEMLLWHSLFPMFNPIDCNGDFNGDGAVTDEDVEMLLWHSLFPEFYPL